MKQIVTKEWQDKLQPFFDSTCYQTLRQFLKQEYQQQTIYPPMDEIYAALKLTDFSKVKVCILGQDPYHGENQANGLAFSVRKGVKIPPSLHNIYQELVSDIGCAYPKTGDLSAWAKQGVLLLNTVLTVRAHQAFSHRQQGWELFTDYVIGELNKREQPIVFILWGNASIKKSSLIDTQKHAIITSPHPSPLSAHRGFFGSKPFSRTNDYLQTWQQEPIDWAVVGI